jgi:hypothetical protein
MPKYRITVPDAGTYEVTTPEGYSQEQAFELLQGQLGGAGRTPEREKTGGLSAAAQGVGQGLSFGLSDEIEGAVRGGYDALTSDKSFTDAYAERRDVARERLSRAAEDNPVAYYGGEIGSALVVPGGLAKMGVKGALAKSADLGLGARSVAGLKEGAAYGAAYGFGTGQGGVEDHAQNMLTSAALGGAIGGAIPAAVDVGANVAGHVTRGVRGYRDPDGMASEKLTEAMARHVGKSGSPADIVAAREEIAKLAAEAADNPHMMVADIGGETTRRLMRQANNMPNDNVTAFNKALDTRQEGQWSRLEGGLAKALGSPDDYSRAVDDVIARRSSAASSEFAEAMAVDVPMTPQLQGVMQRPAMQSLIKNVEASLANEGQAVGLETRMQALHRLKMELDNQIGTAKRAQAMGNDRTAGMDARTLTILKRDLLDAVDNPAYQKALQNFAGESALANAAEEGFEKALRLPTEEIGKALAKMTAGEQEMWRMGAARAIAGRIREGDVMRDRTKGVFSSPDMRMRLKAIFPDDATLQEFERLLSQEGAMAQTRRAVQGGSATDRNLITAQEAGAPMRAIQAAKNLATGNWLEPVVTAVGRGLNRFSGLNPASANALLTLGMKPAAAGMPQGVENALLRAARAPSQRAQLSNRLAVGAVGATQGPGKPKRSQ